MLHQLKSERSRLRGAKRAAKVLWGALGGLAITAASFASAAVMLPSAAGARTIAHGSSTAQLTAAEREAAAHGDLGLGATGLDTYTNSGCRGASGYGLRYMGDRWPGGFKGVPVFSNGTSGSFHACLHRTRTPRGRVVVDGYAWQCVELVDRLYLHRGWIESSWRGNGNQMFYTAPRKFRRQRQGHISYVHPGDVISFNSPWGGYGHAAVVSRVQGHYLTIVNQNTNRANMVSHAFLRRGRIEMIGWRGWRPIGIVHRPGR